MTVLGDSIEIHGVKAEKLIDSYESLLKEILEMRAKAAGSDKETAKSRYDSIVSWIRSTDFYDAPASTRYHESFKHGLLFHSLNVYNNMLELLKVPKFNVVDVQSAALVCLVHDWCKINLYEPYLKNVKDETTGQWYKEEAYKFGDPSHPFGHGVTSMYMAMKMFKLSEDEALAIRWHMGHWQVDDANINDLQYANENYPLVHLIQFADQLAIVNY